MTSSTRHTQATRRAILDATHQLMQEHEGTDFPVQAVADRAGITHRSVYRYFPSRELLLIAAVVARIFPEQAGEGDPPASLRDWVAYLEERFAKAEGNFRMLRQALGAVIASDAYSQREGGSSERFDQEWQLFKSEFPLLDGESAREQFALFRQIGSSLTYIAYRTDYGLSADRATRLIQETLYQMIERLHEAGEGA